ncbi:hypothetical protein ACFP2T_31610 [Plantactinospora solaniradicis]|uniref:Lipoprotein n=1 Tax=Plantactinospora solaniradicis TaxID=1723736 RepID=A0ABW1KIV5_9ACTN
MKLRIFAAAGAATIVLAGCTDDGSGKPSASSGVTNQAALIEAAACMRAHGFPEFPDPVETDGRWAYPAPAPNILRQPNPDCDQLLRRAGAIPEITARAVTADEMSKLRKWADCIRTNGVPDWPDPEADAVFRPSRFLENDDPVWRKADEACRHLEFGPITVDPGSGHSKTGGSD